MATSSSCEVVATAVLLAGGADMKASSSASKSVAVLGVDLVPAAALPPLGATALLPPRPLAPAPRPLVVAAGPVGAFCVDSLEGPVGALAGG